MAAKTDSAGQDRASRLEKNNYPQGRSGGETKILPGPVKSVKSNPTQSGGINRATRKP